MKYETIKQHAIEQLRGAVSIGSVFPSDALFLVLQGSIAEGRNPHELAQEWAEKAVQIIREWDVRMVRNLIELFPGCVPKKFQGLLIRCEMANNEKCDWIVTFGQEDGG
jgi:hypothetical protein